MLQRLCSLLVASAFALVLPTETSAANSPPERLKVGLVLGGGGARGAAHIGVLEVLEKHQVKIDCIAGTSMGALVAGSYAGGLSPKVMREALSQANWRDMFIDSPDYSEQNYRNKQISARFIPGSEMGVTENGIEFPPGVVAGQKIRMFFNRLVQSDIGEREIESLKMPLSIIATDIGTGERVVFRDGSLTTAMRASMSVPGLLAPVTYGKRKLVDGGLVDNVPIAEVKERCNPDVVIAVNVGSPLLKPEEIGSLFSVSAQMVNILTEQNVAKSLALLRPSDIYIQPDLEGVSAGDFERNAEVADRGRKAAEAIVERLKALSTSSTEYANWWSQIEIAEVQPPIIDDILISGLRYVNPGTVEQHLRIKPGDTIDPKLLYSDIQRIYGDGFYERVEYKTLPIRDRHLLAITPVEKPWGPDYLRLGMSLTSDKITGSQYMLRGVYQKTWLNSLGGELLIGGEVGSNPNFVAEYYQPLDARQKFFVETNLGKQRQETGLFQNGNRLAEYRVDREFATLSAGANIGVLGQVRSGWREQKIKVKLETGTPMIPISSVDNSGWLTSLDLEQFDQLYFPTRGWQGQFRHFKSVDNDYSRIDGKIGAAYSLNDYVINTRLTRTVGTNGALPNYDPASLGGLFNLSAYGQGQILGGSSTYGHIRAEKIVGRMPLGLRGDMRVGLALEKGRVKDHYTETGEIGWLNSTTLYLGGETPIGAIYLGYSRSTEGSSNVYFMIGTP